MKTPVFITGNQYKADYLAKWLDSPIEHRKLDLDEIQAVALHAVVEHKVKQAYAIVGRPVLVEDVALVFTAMGRLPGTLIKWFIEELDLDGLCKLADGLDHRGARAEILYGLHDGQQIHYFYAARDGRIAETPRGSNGFGWNAIFIPDGMNKTYAELTDDELRQAGHRAEAVAQVKSFLTATAN